jgi:uncharacterized membrane protein YgcG
MRNLRRFAAAPLCAATARVVLGLTSLGVASGCSVETADQALESAANAVTGPNLALNKSATGSAPCVSTEGPEKAVNGSVSGGWGDKWCSGAPSPWLLVDLGTVSQVGQFVVKHAGAGGEDPNGNTRDFTIQTSTDGTNYTTVVTVTGNLANVTTHDITAANARYVRINTTKPTSNGQAYARVYELEVYGTGGGGSGGSGGSGGAGGGTGGSAGSAGSSGAWQLAWADEFNGSGLLNSNDWTYEVGRVRNSEAQYYTSADLDNARQEDGNLVIEARKESLNGASYTSASVTTRNRHTFLYGRLEVRAKLPGGVGTWPAIWMLGTSGGWPAGGEIDIMENVGFEPNAVHATIHTQADPSGAHQATVGLDQPYNQFYVYALEWTPDRLDFFIDSNKVYTFNNDGTGTASWPFSKPEYLLINLAIGGNWGGQHGIDDSIFPRRYYIDYVRYYTAK